MKEELELLEEEYKRLKAQFGVNHSSWNMLHQEFNRLVFCPENRKDLIAEYLIWEDFVKRAKSAGFTYYYYGIDEFLTEYRKAVYSCLTNLE